MIDEVLWGVVAKKGEHAMTMADQDDEVTGSSGITSTRRTMLLGVGAVGAVGLLAACGTDGATPASTSSPGVDVPPPTPEVMKTADIPVGGGMVYKVRNVVVTQPTADSFKAFTATCQHLGCQVASVRDGTINCPCHGSQYHIADGSVAHGPTTTRLPEMHVVVSAGIITVS